MIKEGRVKNMKSGLKRIIAKGTVLLAAVSLVIGSLQAGKVAADPSATLSKSGSAEVGKTISVNIGVSGDGPYGGFNGKISFDSSYLEVVSISSGNYGAANFSNTGSSFLDYNCNIPSGSTIVVVKMKCLKEGTTTISTSLNVSSLDGAFDYSTGSSAEINISAPVVLSNNNNLSSLSVAPGTLSPSFSRGTTTYHVTVSENTSSITVSATAEHGAAKVSTNGVQKDLQKGDNTVKINVTAENGEVKTYKIIVTRGTPTPTPEPYPVIVTNGESFTILEPDTLETIPNGFVWSETTYNTKKVPCMVGPNGMLMMWLLSDEGNGLYIYDLASQTVAPCYAYTSDPVSMMIIPFPSDFAAPAGYEKTTYTYNGHEVEAYKNTQQEGLPMLIYLLNAEGNGDVFYVDEQTGMILPFRGEIAIATPTPVPTNTPTPTPTPTPTSSPTPTPTPEPASGNIFKTTTIILGIVTCALLAILVALLVARNKDQRGPADPDDTYEENDEEETPDNDNENDSSDNEGDHYYQFGDEEPEPRRPGAKRAGESEPVKEESKKEEPLPDFPEFPEKKPEPSIETGGAAPLIKVVDTKDDEKTDDPSDDQKNEPDNGEENDDEI